MCVRVHVHVRVRLRVCKTRQGCLCSAGDGFEGRIKVKRVVCVCSHSVPCNM